MAERLKNILTVQNLAANASVTLPHRLMTSTFRPLTPDIVYVPSPDLEVDADEINVTLINTGCSPVSGSVLVEAWHTIERAFEDVNDEDLPVKPYVVVNGCCSNEPEIVYLAANQLSKQPPDNPDPDGFLINPNGGTPDGIAVIEIDPRECSGYVIPQPQPEGWSLPVAPYRDPGGALVYNAEAHHFNISKDKTRLIAFGLNNNFVYVYDISGAYKRYPKLLASVNLDSSGYMGPHDCAELGDGTFLVTMSGNMSTSPPGKGPGGLIQIDRDGNFLMDVMATNHTLFPSASISIAINENGIMAYPEFQTHYYFDQWPPGTQEIGHDVVLFKYDVNNPGVITSALQTVTLTGGGFDGFHVSSPTWLPAPLNGEEVLFATAISSGLWVLTRPAGSNSPFVPRLIYQLPVGSGYPQHAAMHVIVMTVGNTNNLKYQQIYLSDTWGNALHVLDISKGLPPPGQYFSSAPNAPFPAQVVSNPNIHWMAFDRPGEHIYTSNMLFSLYDYNLGKYPPATTYELRRFSVDTTGALTSTPDFAVLAPKGYGFVKFKLRNGATFPGTHE